MFCSYITQWSDASLVKNRSMHMHGNIMAHSIIGVEVHS